MRPLVDINRRNGMTMTTRLIPRILSLSSGPAALLFLAANAAAGASFAVKTTAFNLDGYAGAMGTITFLDNNSVRISSQVADHCGKGSGDGEGAYLWAEIVYTDGSSDAGHDLSLNWDSDGCDNGTKPAKTVTFNPGRNVRKVRVRLDEANGPSHPSETVYSPWADNPHT